MKGINRYVMVDEPFSYVAVAENRQFFAVMTPHMLASCIRDVCTVCPSDSVLRTPSEPNCLVALFLGKVDVTTHLRKRLILEDNFEPVWIRSPDSQYRIYSLSNPTQVTVQCQGAELPSNFEPSYQVTLSGTGVLPNSSSCYIHSEIFKLLPHSFGRSEVTLNRTHIMLPNIHDILNSLERELLQPSFKEPVAMQLVNAVIERATSRSTASGFNVKHIIRTLHDEQQQHQPSTLSWIIGATAICISIVILIVLVTSLHKSLCLYLSNCVRVARKPRLTPCSLPDALELKCETSELQAQSHSNIRGQPETTVCEGRKSKSRKSPTCFVQHGVVEAEA